MSHKAKKRIKDDLQFWLEGMNGWMVVTFIKTGLLEGGLRIYLEGKT